MHSLWGAAYLMRSLPTRISLLSALDWQSKHTLLLLISNIKPILQNEIELLSLSFSLGETGWKVERFKRRTSWFLLMLLTSKTLLKKTAKLRTKEIFLVAVKHSRGSAVWTMQILKKPQIIMKYPCNGITKATGNITILVPLFKVQFLKWGILGKWTNENKVSGLQPEERNMIWEMSNVIKHTSVSLHVRRFHISA